MQIAKQIDNALDTIQSIILSLLVKLGPFFVALMPALFTGYAVYATFSPKVGAGIALFFALVVSVAMETVGIVATHTAVDLYNGTESEIIHPEKFWLMTSLVPIYAIGVAGVVYFSDGAFEPLVKALGVASPFLTVIVYIAVALARDLSNAHDQQASVEGKQDATEAERLRWQREKERLEMELKHAEKLERIRAKVSNKSLGQSVKEAPNENADNANGAKGANLTGVNLTREEKKQSHLDTLLDIYLDNPNTGVSEISRRLGVSRQTVYNYQNELEQAGTVHRNGQGVEVLSR